MGREADPMFATGHFGKVEPWPTPRIRADWGCNFVYWDQYAKLWTNAVDWLIAD